MSLRIFFLVCLFYVLNFQSILAQCCCTTNLGAISPNMNWQYFQHSCLGYVSFPAQAGCTYVFTYCNSQGPSAYYNNDPYLTVQTGVAAGTVAANDDWCGLGSYISWTAPSTQTYYLQLGSWAQGASCACNVNRNLAYRSTNCAGGVTSPTSITASAASICAGQSVTLTANGTMGTQNWYTGSCGGAQIGTGATLTVSPNVTTTYFVNNNSNGQASPSCASLTITVNPSPSAPTVNGNLVICGSGSTVLTASGGLATYNWYANAAGSTLLGTGSSFTTPVLNATTTYYVNTQQAGNFGVGSQTFNFTGGPQSFTAPVTGTYTFDVYGARGGNVTSYYPTNGGLGGRAQGTTTLTAGQIINLYVGGQGQDRMGNHPYGTCTFVPGGWNGGGANRSAGNGTPGGGASDIRVGGNALANRIIVAGGGGGCGWSYAAGGHGGGLTGNNGTNSPNSGGTQVAGGALANSGGPCGVTAGTLGQGGDGSGWSAGGGGGGGGYYGGGGGGYNNGGGGGSSFVGGVNGGTTTTGVQNGNGQIIISWNAQGCPSPLTPVTVTVNPQPVVTTAGATICSGQTATLTATASVPGGIFTWNPGNLTGSSVTVTPNTTTQYTVSYSAAGCPPVTATATVTVNALPAAPAANNVTLCGPGTATLTATGGQNNNYIWFANSNGTGQLSTNASYTTPNLQSTTTYYVQTATAQGGSQNFPYTGGVQNFTAPISGVYTIEAWGAKGGDDGNIGANGGYATGTVALTAGQTLVVYTGGMGASCAVGGGGGWNGGGNAGPQGCSGGGGGASDVRLGGVALGNRILVAGGGGGAGCCGQQAGAGGGLNGNNGSGGGGTQAAGGGGNAAGALGQGGNKNGDGGGGGGGYYGGGAAFNDDGGGGGSSYIGGVLGGNSIAGNASMPNPIGGNMTGNAGNGFVRITWLGVSCPSALTPVTVTVNPVPVVSVTNDTVCAGQTTTLTATSTVPGGTFTWSPGGTTGSTITVTPNTTTTYTASYSVVGCPAVTGTGTVTINPLQPITGTLSACLGLTSQLANAVAPGTWSSSNTGVATISASGLVTGVLAGTSTITYNASNGCSTTSQFTVHPQPVLTATPSNVLCFGGTGSVSLSAAGANAPYTYGATPTQNLSPGTYTYTATSVDGCVSAPVSVTITQPQAALALTTTQVNVLCSGNNTGSINLTVTGGTAPYTYAWSNNTTLEDPTGLASGSYTVTVTDANGCTATTTVTITQPSTLTSSYTQVNVGCFGNSTGSIDLTVSGGVAPYVFAWSNQAVSEDLTNIPSGVYTVTATDANGCTTTQTVTITQPQAPLSLSTTQVNVLCFGNSTGSVNLTATGGTAPYTFLWSNNGTAEDPTGMAAGWYGVTVTDANGCVDTTSVIITQPQAGLALTTTQVNVLCFGNSTGSVNLTVTGGTAPYTYAWSNNTALEDPTGLAAGTYTVTVTDANGCTATTTVTITEPASAVSVTTQSQNILCVNGTGSVSSTPSGGVAPYTYSWTNNATTQNITNLQAGSYTVTVQDANGCTAQSTGTVATTLSPLPVQILNITGTTILTCTNPTIVLQATGGVTYNWSGGATPLNDTNSITLPGTYTVNMVDPNGCPVSQTITLTQNITPPTPGITNITGTTIIDCNAPSIDLQATGGGTYQWNNNLGTTSSVNIAQAGTYTVVVTAANGCQDSSTVAITVAPVPAVTGNDTTICSGQSVVLSPLYYPAGGQAIWTNGQSTPSITVSPNTTTMYSVLYTWNGCTATDDITVTVNPTPTVSVNSPNICFGDTTQLTATPNIPNGLFNWITTNETTQSISVNPQATTTYDVEYTLNGCTSAIATSTVTVTPLPIITVPNIIICEGGSGTLTATPNVAGGTFTWSQGGSTASITESPQATTSYSVSYTVNGCTSNVETPSITVNPLPNVSFTADTTSGCIPVVVNLSADTTGQQATYTWTSNGASGSTGSNAQMLFSVGGCYDVTLTATLNGCSFSATQPDFVCVQDYPQASFEANPPSFSESSQVINFNNTSVGATGYVWNFGDGNVSNQEYPEHLFQGTNDGYTITLIASTSMGCMDSTSFTMSANLGAVYYIPNTFTPDGDKYNQTFKPVFSTGISTEQYEMLIFNRWGEIMFESNNIYIGWDGSYGVEGLDCPSGTYTYKIKFTLNGGLQEQVIVTGHVNLLR